MSEDFVYIDGSRIANTGLELINSNRKREYAFLSNLADFISDEHYHVKRGEVFSLQTALSKKKIEQILADAQIPFRELRFKGHIERTAFIEF